MPEIASAADRPADKWEAAHHILDQPDIASRITHCYEGTGAEATIDLDKLIETIGPWSRTERFRVRVAIDVFGHKQPEPVTLDEMRHVLLDPEHRKKVRLAAMNSGVFADHYDFVM